MSAENRPTDRVSDERLAELLAKCIATDTNENDPEDARLKADVVWVLEEMQRLRQPLRESPYSPGNPSVGSPSGASAEPVVASDHPDFVGGVVWSPLELRWINQKLAEARRSAPEPSSDYLHTQLREWWVRSNGGEDHAAPFEHILRSLIRVADGKSSGEPSVKPLTLGRLVMDMARGVRPSGPLTDQERREVQASINAGFEKYYKGPFQFRPPVDENGAPYIYDAAGNVVAMLMWPGHPPEETEAAEQATYAMGEAMAAACSVPEPGTKPVQILGLCDKHMHIGHFPAEAVAPPMPPIETVCPWCVRSTSTKDDAHG